MNERHNMRPSRPPTDMRTRPLFCA